MSANNNREGVRLGDARAPDKPTEDFLRGYEGGYDQALFDQAQEFAPKTLRDEFAMAALTGLVTKDCDPLGFRWDCEARVKVAYRYADAMLTARGDA